MCRLMGYSSKERTSLPNFMGGSFQQFVDLSNIHHDSWGLALLDNGDARITKKAETAAKSSHFTTTMESNAATGGLLHFRWASPGLPISDESAHPFTRGDIAFIHNGALSPYDALQSRIDSRYATEQKGFTDSEQFFFFILTEIDRSGFVEGVKSAIHVIKSEFQYSSINSMIMNSDYMIVTSEHDPVNKPSWADDVYYEIRYRLDENGLAVASSGWDQSGWTLLGNHQMLIFNRNNHEIELINL
ncbi:MAG: class II glutamine amidotransferase [Actinomycetota bacterium]